MTTRSQAQIEAAEILSEIDKTIIQLRNRDQTEFEAKLLAFLKLIYDRFTALTVAAEVGEPLSRTELEIRTEERYVTIERCAQVAETFEINNTPEAWSLEGMRRGTAAAIRKMKEGK